MRPWIVADALERAPQLPTLSAILARRWHARRLAVLDDFRQMHRHVCVNVKDLAVHDQPTEATNQALFNGELLQKVTEKKFARKTFLSNQIK